MDHRTVHPYGDRILIRLGERKEKTGSLFVPQNSRLSTWQGGEVVAVGPGSRGRKGGRRPPELVPGQHAYFDFAATDGKSMGTWESFKDENDGRTYVLAQENSFRFRSEEPL